MRGDTTFALWMNVRIMGQMMMAFQQQAIKEQHGNCLTLLLGDAGGNKVMCFLGSMFCRAAPGQLEQFPQAGRDIWKRPFTAPETHQNLLSQASQRHLPSQIF